MRSAALGLPAAASAAATRARAVIAGAAAGAGAGLAAGAAAAGREAAAASLGSGAGFAAAASASALRCASRRSFMLGPLEPPASGVSLLSMDIVVCALRSGGRGGSRGRRLARLLQRHQPADVVAGT